MFFDEEITDCETQDYLICDVSGYLRGLCVSVVKFFMNCTFRKSDAVMSQVAGVARTSREFSWRGGAIGKATSIRSVESRGVGLYDDRHVTGVVAGHPMENRPGLGSRRLVCSRPNIPPTFASTGSD